MLKLKTIFIQFSFP